MKYSAGIYVDICSVSEYAELRLMNPNHVSFFDISVRGYKFREEIKLKCIC